MRKLDSLPAEKSISVCKYIDYMKVYTHTLIHTHVHTYACAINPLVGKFVVVTVVGTLVWGGYD